MTAATVFVVDDDPAGRESLARLIESMGVRVETFARATELLARAPAGEHGCIVLDIKMSASGIELQRELKDADIDMPVIFLSAHPTVRLSVQAMKQGAVDVITKPFDEQTLIGAVRTAIAIDERRQREHDEYLVLRRRLDLLTPREQTVMMLVVTGKLNKEVAALLGTSVKTVKAHRGQVMTKMQASSLAELVRMADRLGFPDKVPDPS